MRRISRKRIFIHLNCTLTEIWLMHMVGWSALSLRAQGNLNNKHLIRIQKYLAKWVINMWVVNIVMRNREGVSLWWEKHK